ncbi:MAG: hypothetical protein GX962_03910 [Epulopiscium sp.]|nr:hypothetical protein [Candidatus Epulonipiscium sp.]
MGFIIIPFIILAVAIFFLQGESHERRIHTEVQSIGGEVISIERKVFGRGPFVLVGKGQVVYRIEYQVGTTRKEGWVKFGSLFGPDWRL